MNVLVINGPNLNMLGYRPKEHYGSLKLDDINKLMEEEKGNLNLEFFQSNSEEDILRSTTKSAISTYFGDVMNRYNSSSFQDYRLLQQVFGFENLKNGTFTSIKFFNADGSEDATRTANYKNYVTKVRNTVDGSKELESTSPFSGWFDENWTVDLTKCEKYHYDVD
jgi:hypothetical protein